MKSFYGFIFIIIAGFLVNKYVLSSKAYDGVTKVTDIISSYPINVYDFKKTMADYAYHLCYKNEGVLSNHNISISECVDNHDERKLDCDKKVFRLAPLNLETKEDVLDYSKQYTQCTLPYKYILG